MSDPITPPIKPDPDNPNPVKPLETGITLTQKDIMMPSTVDISDINKKNTLLEKELSDIKKLLVDQSNTAELKEHQIKLDAALIQLQKADPRLFERHKNEKDIKTLELLIQTANDFSSNFSDYESDNKGKTKSKPDASNHDTMSYDFVEKQWIYT